MPNVIEPQETVIVYVSIPQPVAVTVGVNPITAITIGEQGPPGVVALTTNGNNGAATFSGGNLNVPNYTLSGLGGQPALGYTPIKRATHLPGISLRQTCLALTPEMKQTPQS